MDRAKKKRLAQRNKMKTQNHSFIFAYHLLLHYNLYFIHSFEEQFLGIF